MKSKSSSTLPKKYLFRPHEYIEEKLGWKPWRGYGPERPGQAEVLDAYLLALQQQHEKQAYQNGFVRADQLHYWQPGTQIKNYIAVDAGHNVGKTKLASGIVNHFFDCAIPSIGYTFAPTWEQIHDLLWKEIKVDRDGKNLPGQVLDLELRGFTNNHFTKGRATNNSQGSGTERTHGQHNWYLIFVLDEAEGIPSFVWDAVDSMTSGGISIVLVLRNPRTRTSMAHKMRSWSNVAAFRISCLWHPNVVENRDVIPNSVTRDYVDKMLKHCIVVPEHEPDELTFELEWRPGEIWKPGREYLWRVEGRTPATTSDDTFCPTGRFEAAVNRSVLNSSMASDYVQIGVDVARYGNDSGTIYELRGDELRNIRRFETEDTSPYVFFLKEHLRQLHTGGVRRVSIRVDGTGGYGSGVIDPLRVDDDLRNMFAEFHLHEVLFNESATNSSEFANAITELYYWAGQAMHYVNVVDPPEYLQDDLCERTFVWRVLKGQDVKRLTPKEEFRTVNKRSPDDGDGAALALAPERAVTGGTIQWPNLQALRVGEGGLVKHLYERIDQSR